MDTQMPTNISIKSIDKALTDCPDIIRKKIYINNQYEAFFLFISGLIDLDIVQRDFIGPLSSMSLQQLSNENNIHNLPCNEMLILYDLNTLLDNILAGNSVFICEQLPFAVACTLTNFEKRSIEEPETEKNIRGPHEGFIESLYTNLSILRRKIRNTKLKFKTITLGVQTEQKVVLAYIDGIVNIENDEKKT